jgi:pimeloyl-ACP methyl ester carboxylesterase
MIKRPSVIAVLALAHLTVSPSSGQAQLTQRMTVEWQNARLSQVVDAMARFSRRRIVLPADVGLEEVTVAFQNTDWRVVLDSILQQHALVARTDSSDVIHVEKRAIAAKVGRVSAAAGIRFITVERNVNLEVIDWGGGGRPVVLLAGLGSTAHDLEEFARLLTSTYHVYGITRRGFGASSAPATGYSADRLADDVLAVIDSLGLKRPVLAGHSLAGEELSSIGSRHPEKVAGLVYLDAAYPYAFYNRARGDYRIDLNELRRRLEQLGVARSAAETRRLITQLLETDLPAFDRVIRGQLAQLPPASQDAPAPAAPPKFIGFEPSPAMDLIMAGTQRYTDIRSPVLAIYALPHRVPQSIGRDSALLAGWLAAQAEWPAQAEAFERGVPTARVVRIPNADHAVFHSNPSEVLREMHAFIASLPPSR